MARSKKTGRLELAVTEHDKQQWQTEAAKEDVPLSHWVRRACKAWLAEQRKRRAPAV